MVCPCQPKIIGGGGDQNGHYPFLVTAKAFYLTRDEVNI